MIEKKELTPKQIVNELNRYIIGQNDAKKAVAVALRNRFRRRQLPTDISDEITPKNIIMKGPTGVGKTEIARRLAKLVKAPFVKVEATKFTEVGYVGRDVESMIRDLVEVSIRLVREEKIEEVEPKAKETAENKIVNALYPIRKKANPDKPDNILKEEIKEELRKGNLDKIPVEIEVEEKPKTLQLGPIGGGGMGMNDNNIGDIFGSLMPKRRKKRKTTVGDAFKIFVSEEANKLIDKDSINTEALKRAEQDGIIFIDEIDKIASRTGKVSGPEVSREGVQRDILPIVEGSTIATKYGNLKTDYILFIATGAFHTAKVSDLIPELQGRFPVIVDLQSLSEEDFYKILKEPDNAIIMQYSELLKVDKITLKFSEEAIKEMAKIAFLENENNENIGARRLHNVMEMLLEEVSYEADGEKDEEIVVDKKFVQQHLEKALKTMNLKKYIL